MRARRVRRDESEKTEESDPLDFAELHSFRLVYFKHKEIFLVVCIVSDGSPVLSMPAY